MTESKAASSGRIFISYRRQDTAWQAVALYHRLTERFGTERIFKDIDNIKLGEDFVTKITDEVESCDILLALIGKSWLDIAYEEDGSRRLDDPNDFVRLEIEAALNRDVLLVPILVDGATMPRADKLPPSIAGLTRRQALELSPNRFSGDTDHLLVALQVKLAELEQQQSGPESRLTPQSEQELESELDLKLSRHEPAPVPERVSEPEVEPEPETGSDAEPEPPAESTHEAVTEPEAQPEFDAEQEPVSEPAQDPEPEAEPAAKPEPVTETPTQTENGWFIGKPLSSTAGVKTKTGPMSEREPEPESVPKSVVPAAESRSASEPSVELEKTSERKALQETGFESEPSRKEDGTRWQKRTGAGTDQWPPPQQRQIRQPELAAESQSRSVPAPRTGFVTARPLLAGAVLVATLVGILVAVGFSGGFPGDDSGGDDSGGDDLMSAKEWVEMVDATVERLSDTRVEWVTIDSDHAIVQSKWGEFLWRDGTLQTKTTAGMRSTGSKLDLEDVDPDLIESLPKDATERAGGGTPSMMKIDHDLITVTVGSMDLRYDLDGKIAR